jgi:thioredoxin 1
MTALVQDLTSTTFDEVLGAEVPVVVDLWAQWCGPCHALAPVLDAVAAEHAGELQIAKVDVDAYPDVARRFGVMGFPTLLVFDRGELVARLVGARGRQRLLAELADVLGRQPATRS